MDSIAVTKPDMGVLGQNRTGLSPFGILSALFTRDILDRTEQQIGWYEPLSLQFLEDGEEEERQTRPPEITLKFDLDVLLKTIREQQMKNEAEEKSPKTPEQRILERIVLREREVVVRDAGSRRIILQSGDRRFDLSPRPGESADALRRRMERAAESAVTARSSDRAGISGGGRRQELSPQTDPSAGPARRPMRSPAEPAGAARSAGPDRFPGDRSGGVSERSLFRSRPGRESLTVLRDTTEGPLARKPLEVRADVKPLTPMALATRAAVSPAAGGWEPKWQEAHPGFPLHPADPEKENPAGSILLPDVMRRRRTEAIERHERRSEEAAKAVRELELDWRTESTEEASGYLDQFTRTLKQAVDRALEKRWESETRETGTPPRASESREKPASAPSRRAPEAQAEAQGRSAGTDRREQQSAASPRPVPGGDDTRNALRRERTEETASAVSADADGGRDTRDSIRREAPERPETEEARRTESVPGAAAGLPAGEPSADARPLPDLEHREPASEDGNEPGAVRSSGKRTAEARTEVRESVSRSAEPVGADSSAAVQTERKTSPGRPSLADAKTEPAEGRTPASSAAAETAAQMVMQAKEASRNTLGEADASLRAEPALQERQMPPKGSEIPEAQAVQVVSGTEAGAAGSFGESMSRADVQTGLPVTDLSAEADAAPSLEHREPQPRAETESAAEPSDSRAGPASRRTETERSPEQGTPIAPEADLGSVPEGSEPAAARPPRPADRADAGTRPAAQTEAPRPDGSEGTEGHERYEGERSDAAQPSQSTAGPGTGVPVTKLPGDTMPEPPLAHRESAQSDGAYGSSPAGRPRRQDAETGEKILRQESVTAPEDGARTRIDRRPVSRETEPAAAGLMPQQQAQDALRDATAISDSRTPQNTGDPERISEWGGEGKPAGTDVMTALPLSEGPEETEAAPALEHRGSRPEEDSEPAAIPEDKPTRSVRPSDAAGTPQTAETSLEEASRTEQGLQSVPRAEEPVTANETESPSRDLRPDSQTMIETVRQEVPSEPMTGLPAAESGEKAETAPILAHRAPAPETIPGAAARQEDETPQPVRQAEGWERRQTTEPYPDEAPQTGQDRQLVPQAARPAEAERQSPLQARAQEKPAADAASEITQKTAGSEPLAGVPVPEGAAPAETAPPLEYRESAGESEPEASASPGYRASRTGNRAEGAAPRQAEASDPGIAAQAGEDISAGQQAGNTAEAKRPQSLSQPQRQETPETDAADLITKQITKEEIPQDLAAAEPLTGLPAAESAKSAGTAPVLEHREAAIENKSEQAPAPETGMDRTARQPETAAPRQAEVSDPKEAAQTGEDPSAKRPAGNTVEARDQQSPIRRQRHETPPAGAVNPPEQNEIAQRSAASEPLTGLPAEEGAKGAGTAPVLEHWEAAAATEHETALTPEAGPSRTACQPETAARHQLEASGQEEGAQTGGTCLRAVRPETRLNRKKGRARHNYNLRKPLQQTLQLP